MGILGVIVILIAGSMGQGQELPERRFTARPLGQPAADVVAAPLPSETHRRFEIRMTPRDASGARPGSERAAEVRLEVSAGRLLGDLEDAGGGLLRQVRRFPRRHRPAR